MYGRSGVWFKWQFAAANDDNDDDLNKHGNHDDSRCGRGNCRIGIHTCQY
jgi:hypothetical protein